MAQMTDKEKLRFYDSLMIYIHTANWTGDRNKNLPRIMKAIGAFSYAHTNSNAGDEFEPDKIFERFVTNIEEAQKPIVNNG